MTNESARRGAHVRLCDAVVVIVFLAIVLSTFAQVVFRYVLSFSLPWADEIARFGLVWLVYMGMVSALVRGQHVSVEFLLARYRGPLGVWMHNLIDLAGVVLFGTLLYGGVLLMQMTGSQITPGLGISKAWVYLALPVGAALMILEFGLRMWRRTAGRNDDAQAMTGI